MVQGQVLRLTFSSLTFQTKVAGVTLSIFKYTVTSNTTVFTGNDDDNQSLLYTVGENKYF